MNTGGRIALATATVVLAFLIPGAAAHAGGGIILSMTAVVDETPENTLDDQCGTKERLTVDRGDFVDVCYTVRNTSSGTLNRHDLTDSVNGQILDDFPFTLTSGAFAFIVDQAKVRKKTRFKGLWVAGGASIESDRDELPVKVRR